jgi:preprotein translocase subunit SecB
MSEENNNPTSGVSQDGPAGASLQVLAQYVKDLSFENPNAPDSLRAGDGQQNISVNANVNVQQLNETEYEVGLAFKIETKRGDEVSFLVELTYCGVFRVENIPQESLHPVLLIEAPRQLFPFARRVLADATRDGGYPPLLLDPIDFVDLYRRNMEARNGQDSQAPTGENKPN